MHALPCLVGSRVGTAAVDRRSEVDDRRAGGHLGSDEISGLRGAAAVPQMAAGSDARRAVLGREVDEREHRRHLHVTVRLRQVGPHGFVTMEELVRGARAAVEQLRHVQPVARAARQQDLVADRAVERVREHIRCEDA